jgi:hypothetical protein
VSRVNNGFIWAHQDSGSGTTLYLLDPHTGFTKGVINVRGVGRNGDWEDMTIGGCGAKVSNTATCLYVGDIGDNGRSRSDCSIIRVTEPDVTSFLASGKWFGLNIWGDKFYFQYPTIKEESLRSHNAESMLLTPNGTVAIITKRTDGQARVFEFEPLEPNWSRAKLHYVGTIPSPEVSSHPTHIL